MRHATSSEHARGATGKSDGLACRMNGNLDSLRSVMADVIDSVFRSPRFLQADAFAPLRTCDISTVCTVS